MIFQIVSPIRKADRSIINGVEIQDKTSSIKDDEKNHEDIEEMLRDFMQTRVLETVYEEEERSWDSPLPDKIHGSQQQIQDFQQTQSVSQNSSTDQLTQFKQLLESTPNRLVQTRKLPEDREKNINVGCLYIYQKICDFDYTPCRSSLFISYHSSISFFRMIAYLNNLVLMLKVIEYDRRTLVRHALAEKYDEMEDFFSFAHLHASCNLRVMFTLSLDEVEVLFCSHSPHAFMYINTSDQSKSVGMLQSSVFY
ncbi:hypothetical protein NC653_010766 [Populus alba x Populus x berolinensis]|uniref:Uncharacterized protein n=1 Tax=Populus alba x Populus x berolinensis TaxID=444605 RepID=A0AAD6W5J5_9ROSI|nr:hypothetical protein NC653_010766 [Populus alba x Populus x berolinensis]